MSETVSHLSVLLHIKHDNFKPILKSSQIWYLSITSLGSRARCGGEGGKVGPTGPQRKLAVLAIFLHSMKQKWDQGTLGRQRLTLIGLRTWLGPSMEPAIALQYPHSPLYIGYIFACYLIPFLLRGMQKYGQYSRFSPAGHLAPPPA